jgi:hypothetical protein
MPYEEMLISRYLYDVPGINLEPANKLDSLAYSAKPLSIVSLSPTIQFKLEVA